MVKENTGSLTPAVSKTHARYLIGNQCSSCVVRAYEDCAIRFANPNNPNKISLSIGLDLCRLLSYILYIFLNLIDQCIKSINVLIYITLLFFNSQPIVSYPIYISSI